MRDWAAFYASRHDCADRTGTAVRPPVDEWPTTVMTLGCTIIARNYLADAQSSPSFLRHHPGRRFVVLVVDQGRGEEVGAGESFKVWGLDDLGDHGRTFHEMAAVYSAMELATAVKPWLLERLLAEHDGPVVYLDPDCEVHAPIDDVAQAAMRTGWC